MHHLLHYRTRTPNSLTSAPSEQFEQFEQFELPLCFGDIGSARSMFSVS